MASDVRVSTFALHSIFCEVGKVKDSKDEEGAFAADNWDVIQKCRGLYFRVNEETMPFSVDAEYINFYPKRMFAVEGLDKDGKIDSNILVSVKAGQIVESGKTCSYGAVDASGEIVNSGVTLDGSSGCLFGKTAMVSGDTDASLTSSSQAALMFDVGGGNSYSGVSDAASNMAKIAERYFEILTKLEDIPHFSYKKEYLDIRGEDPYIVESPWTNIYKINPKWGKEETINSTMPWPGKGSHVKTFRQDQSELVKVDDALGDKDQQDEEHPEESNMKFEEYRG